MVKVVLDKAHIFSEKRKAVKGPAAVLLRTHTSNFSFFLAKSSFRAGFGACIRR